MKKLAAALVLLAIPAVARLAGVELEKPDTDVPAMASAAPAGEDDGSLAQALADRANDVQVQGAGTVVRILPDDNEGSRHQRFLVRVAPDHTILIAHNIDLAPRVAPLAEGDTVSFNGEFAWNGKGGVVHWTHHDPAGRHLAGWIRRDDQVFQ